MTDARPRRRPAARVTASVLLAALFACGRTESHWQMKTAGEWGESLWSPDTALVTQAETALRTLRKSDPAGVVAALEKALKARPPKPTATPFSLAVDVEGARALGLAPVPPAEAVQLDLPIVRERIRAMSIGSASLRGTTELDVVLMTLLDRAELLRLQARLVTRGALDLRALAHDPARPPRGAEEEEAAAALASEVARFVAAREAKAPYAPADARRRAVPRAGSRAAVPADFVLVVEPAEAEDALDERSVATAALTVSPTGAPAVTVTWRDDLAGPGRTAGPGRARERVKRFAVERAGRRLVVVCDGEAVATPETPAVAATAWVLPVAAKDDPAARERAAALAVAWPLGRLPYPLTPIPPAATYGADPAPDNQVARITAGFGKLVVPMLERVSKDAPEAYTRAAASWALDEIKRGVGAREDEN